MMTTVIFPITLPGAPPPPRAPARVITPLTASTATANQFAYGTGFIAGTVKVEGAPSARRVRLYDWRTAQLIAETWSADDGSYRFERIDAARLYFVIAFDHERLHNAAIADIVTPVAMP